MKKLNISDEVMEKFKTFVLGKHGKLRGCMREETEKALKNLMEEN